jgi:hypothetical protein
MELLKHINIWMVYFSMTDMTLEPSEPDYTPSVEVVLPGTLRRFARFNGWTPGKYFEGEY